MSNYLSLNTIKKLLNIDSTFTDDDAYLMMLADVAEKTVQRNICCVLSDVADASGNLPSPLVQAMLLYVGVLYNSREAIAYSGSPVLVPLTFEYLVNLFKNYSDTTSDSFVQNAIDDLAKATFLSDTPEEEELAEEGDVAISISAKDKALQRLAANSSIDADGNYVVNIERI